MILSTRIFLDHSHGERQYRLDKAMKAWFADVRIFMSKPVLVIVNWERVMNHVCSVATLGSENWSWSQTTMNKLHGRETVMMRRLFCFKERLGRPLQKCSKNRKICNIIVEGTRVPLF